MCTFEEIIRFKGTSFISSNRTKGGQTNDGEQEFTI